MRHLEMWPGEEAPQGYSSIPTNCVSTMASWPAVAPDQRSTFKCPATTSRCSNRHLHSVLIAGFFMLVLFISTFVVRGVSRTLRSNHPMEPLGAVVVASPKKQILKGICYAPVPIKVAGQVIPDDDFMSEDTQLLWGPEGRGDLSIMAALGANALRLYGNDPRLSHSAFLEEAARQNLDVTVGLSDYPYIQMPGNCITTGYDCYSQIKDQYTKSLANGFLSSFATYHHALKTIILVNEPDLKFEGVFQALPGNPKHFCKAILSAFDALLDAEKEAYVQGPVPNVTVAFSSGPCKKCRDPDWPAVGQMLELKRAMQDPSSVNYTARNPLWEVYQKRFVNSFNTQNPAIDLRPIFLDTYDSNFQGTPIFISEFHSPAWFNQNLDLKSVLQLAANESTLFMGVHFFEFQVRYDKGGYEKQFGIFGLGNELAAAQLFQIQTSTYNSWCLKRVEAKITEWAEESCGETMMDTDLGAMESETPWSDTVNHVASPGKCCTLCNNATKCLAWTWVRDAGDVGSQCWLKGSGPFKKLKKNGVISGMVGPANNYQPPIYNDQIVADAFGRPGIKLEHVCSQA